jgi:Na+/H+-translocating membrane pyrophosphatase
VPEVFVGGLLGATLIFVFAAWACAAVGRVAGVVVAEVRRQFAERPGIMTYAEKPDYARCVAIVAQESLAAMVAPGLLAVGAPVATGVLFKWAGVLTGQPLLGARAVAGFMMLSTAAGILMALFLNTAGGAWDNAKKYVESGACGGKGSAAHAAAVTGDTVGDPFKDTMGPSLHVVIKLVATLSLVLAPLYV